MRWLIELVLRLAGLFLNRAPPAVAEAEKAGALQAQAKAREAADEAVAAAAAAARQAYAAAAADPERLRDASDPDCRDCQA